MGIPSLFIWFNYSLQVYMASKLLFLETQYFYWVWQAIIFFASFHLVMLWAIVLFTSFYLVMLQAILFFILYIISSGHAPSNRILYITYNPNHNQFRVSIKLSSYWVTTELLKCPIQADMMDHLSTTESWVTTLQSRPGRRQGLWRRDDSSMPWLYWRTSPTSAQKFDYLIE